MKLKEQKILGINPNKSLRIHSLPERVTPDFIHPINHRPLYFTITSSIDEPFIVDWQLGEE
jgi:hypothetical protein